MGISGRTAVGAAFAATGLLVLTAITLEEVVLFAFLGAVALGYLASVIQVVTRGRNLALLVGGIGTSLFIGFAIAFLRMWGLAFNQDAAALGTAVSTQDSDIYFYLAVASGSGTLLVLFAGAVWPSGKRLPSARKASPASRRKPVSASRRPVSTSSPSKRAASPSTRSRSSSAAPKASAARKPSAAPKSSAATRSSPAPKVSAAAKASAASKRAPAAPKPKPPAKGAGPAKATSRR